MAMYVVRSRDRRDKQKSCRPFGEKDWVGCINLEQIGPNNVNESLKLLTIYTNSKTLKLKKKLFSHPNSFEIEN